MNHTSSRDLIRVLVAGASPDALNQNAILRSDVAEGFADVLGGTSVVHCRYETAPRRIRRDRPELVVVFGSVLPDCSNFAAMRRACDEVGARLAFWLHDDPYEFDACVKVVGLADFVFSNDRWSALHYPRKPAVHLPLAASARRFGQIAPWPWREKARDVFFCGVGFRNRQQLLADLQPTLTALRTEIYGDGWDTHVLPFCRNERLSADQLSTHYASSRIILNLGRHLSLANERCQLSASTPGPRTFEAAMAGCCQLMFVDSLEIENYFDFGREILLFDDPSEFRRQVESLLNDLSRGEAIGAAARRRCLREHTYAARATTLLRSAGFGQWLSAGPATAPLEVVDQRTPSASSTFHLATETTCTRTTA
jgi:spore maturation protein CgeB